jgi:hypothetical protein
MNAEMFHQYIYDGKYWWVGSKRAKNIAECWKCRVDMGNIVIMRAERKS